MELLDSSNIQVAAHKILLMPEGIDANILKQSAFAVSELCKRYGFRYTPRLHIDLYGNTRGT